MSDYANSQRRKRSSASSRPSDNTRTTSTKTTPYSGNFEQKLIDTGIYPNLYEHPDGRLSQKPANLSEIQAAQRVSRASLSPSRFTDDDFEAFQRANAKASAETTGMYNVLPFIAGNEATHRLEMGLPFGNLKPFDNDLSDPRPDVYHGAALSTIHPRVRADLGPYIIPSTVDLTRPAAPNFFVEGKSAQGRADVAKRQALIDGAMGARAIHQLQNYKAEEPKYDDKARSFSATYQAGTGTLQLYAHHLTKPLTPGGEPETHMTQTKAFALTSDKDTFVRGATAYRSDRDLAKTERDSSIAHANQVARQMPAPSPNTSLTTSRTSQSTAVVTGSDTSEDELARDEVAPVKRVRPSAASSVSYSSATGRDGRPASGAPMAISRAPLAPPQNTTSTSRRIERLSGEGSISSSTSHTRTGTNGALIERRSDLSRQSQSVQGSGRGRQTRPMVEVNSVRMRHNDESGWCVEHQAKSIFVADSQWTDYEKDGRPAFYCARLHVFTYRPTGNRRR
ncbi:hypothetical protein LTR84_010587 [Exophiala bonariae]|uniref:DUF7924 domain-containing protein n=1 Tax=Exophiala bonariae TaxID=1690606 RepID=A0AAV9MWH4_9EURO|nr:hypothetical protein LTR84_010587 [Exophiala bonariae]